MSFGFGFGFPKRLTSGGGLSPRLYLDFVGTGVLPSTVTFSRGTNATLTDSNGRIAWAPHNLLTNSESFEAAAWAKDAGVSVTANTTAAPDGSTTADTVTWASAANIYQGAIVATGTLTLSVYARVASGTSNFVLQVFNATDGTLSSSTLTATTSWQRFTATFTVTANSFWIIRSSVAQSIFLWGAQLNIANAPVNLLTWSQEFDLSVGWYMAGTGVTSALNNEVAPDGTVSADTITTTIANTGVRQDFNFVSGTTYTVSVYVRSISGATGFTADLQNAQTSPTLTLTSSWQRFTWTVTATAARTWLDFQLDGVGSFAIWGAQLNTGSTALPYVATTSSIYLPPAYNSTTPKNLLGFTQEPENAAWTKSNSYVQQNLLTWSQDFDNAAWNKVLGATVAANTVVAPDGTTTGDTLTFTTTDGNRIEQSAGTAVNGETVTASVWLKGSGTIRLNVGTDTGVGGSTETQITLTSSWVRYTASVTFSSPTGNRRMMVIWRSINTAVNVDAWGAQLVQGSTAGDYTQTTSAAAPTRYLNWDGTLTGRKLVENTATAAHQLEQTLTVVNNTPYTVSVYAKAAERNWVVLYEDSGGNNYAFFNLATGQVGTTSNATASIVSVGSGWYRCAITWTQTIGTTGRIRIAETTGNLTFSYTGDGTSGIYVSDFQLSNSASVDPYVYNPQAAAASAAYYGPRFDYNPTGTPVLSGTELVTNGTFDGGTTTGWTGGNATLAVVSGAMQVTGGTGGNGYAYQAITTVAGARYQLSFTTTFGTETNGLCWVGTSIGANDLATLTWTVAGSKTLSFVATGTTSYIRLGQNTPTTGLTLSFDNISAQLLTGYTATANGLLIEEQRTNFLQRSEDFADAYWGKSGTTVSANTLTAPDGALTADTVIETATSANHFLFRSEPSLTAAGAYTVSVYAKYAGRFLLLVLSNSVSGDTYAYFDLQNGTITQAAASTGAMWTSPAASITNVGSGWYRCTVTGTKDATGNAQAQIKLSNASTGSSSISYTGDGTSGIFIWGAQLEAGSFATSYIPTVASQVTRNADSASMLGDNFYTWYNPNQFVYSVEFVPGVVSNNNVAITFSDGTNDNRAFTSAGTAEHLVVNTGGVSQAFLDGGTAVLGVVNKIAAGVAVNNFGVSVNGGVTATDTSGTVPPLTSMNIGNYRGISSFLNGTIRRIGYYNTRLPDSTLTALTT